MDMRKAEISLEVVFAFILILGICAGGFLFIKALGDEQSKLQKDNISETPLLRTVEHDNHYWIIPKNGEIHSIVHHPDCPKCNKVVEKE